MLKSGFFYVFLFLLTRHFAWPGRNFWHLNVISTPGNPPRPPQELKKTDFSIVEETSIHFKDDSISNSAKIYNSSSPESSKQKNDEAATREIDLIQVIDSI